MTLSLLHPLDTDRLAVMLADQHKAAADWLQEQHDKAGATAQERLLDVLLLYARDAVAYPDFFDVEGSRENVREFARIELAMKFIPERLLHTHFTEAALACWLRTQGDERANEIAGMAVARLDSAVELWFLSSNGKPIDYKTDRTEAAARLDLKRRVLVMFGEVSRKVTMVPVERWAGAYEILHPVDFLPAQETDPRFYPTGNTPLETFVDDQAFRQYLDQLRDGIVRGLGIPPHLIRP